MTKKKILVFSLLATMMFGINTVVNAESYTYDNANRLTGVTYDDGSTIAYTYDATGNRMQKTVSVLAPNISVSPLIYNLGLVLVGNTSTAQTITISNTGTLNLVISSIALTGSNMGEFGVALVTCASLSPTIAAASSCKVMVDFTPTSAGAKAATLMISSNDGDTPALDIALNGTGAVAPDQDKDGMPDAWELQYGLDPNLASDAALDNDNDGISNLDEYNQGSNPNVNEKIEIIKRAEISKPLLQAKYGINYIPPTSTGTVFTDVQPGDYNAEWIEKMAVDGITEGCAVNSFCPDMVVTKEQLSKIILKAVLGSGYVPSAASGSLFLDVTQSTFSASWIEELLNQGIAEGCDANNFCPKEAVTIEGFETMLNKAFP